MEVPGTIMSMLVVIEALHPHVLQDESEAREEATHEQAEPLSEIPEPRSVDPESFTIAEDQSDGNMALELALRRLVRRPCHGA